MKLSEFVEKIKDIKKGTPIMDMPAYDKKDPGKCSICKKAFKPGERDVVSDVSGTLFHRECFDKATTNDELAKRRTDKQLPDGGQLPEDNIEEAEYSTKKGERIDKVATKFIQGAIFKNAVKKALQDNGFVVKNLNFRFNAGDPGKSKDTMGLGFDFFTEVGIRGLYKED